MPEIVYKAFLSCSFDEKDKEIVSFFADLIKAFHIDPEIYNFQEIGALPAKVKEHIAACDCLIAIATRKTKIGDSEQWITSDWVNQEITLANAYNKPIAIFVEEGVKLDGLIAKVERWQPFSRENCLQSMGKIISFLFNLRSHLERERIEKQSMPVLLRHYMHAEEIMRSKDEIVGKCEVLMECLADELEATTHSLDTNDRTPGVSIRPKDFNFICREKPVNTTVEYRIVKNTDDEFFWKIIFNPPLKKGDKVKYAYKHIGQNIRPYTHEELKERINNGTYPFKDTICFALDWTIVYPTIELLASVEFPENYEISGAYVDVRKGLAELKADNEVQRIKDGNMFTMEKIFDNWKMSLKVPNPLQDHTYRIYYVPPKKDDLKA